MEPWLPSAIGALVIWSIQRLVTKVALVRWSTAYVVRKLFIADPEAYLSGAASSPMIP